jgi:flagellar biosynthesis activator protein FlaF
LAGTNRPANSAELIINDATIEFHRVAIGRRNYFMSSATRLYKAVSEKISSPRSTEADLLLEAAFRLQKVQGNWDARSANELDDALRYNRMLWTIFISAVTKAENPLPNAIRQNVANLGIFVMKHTLTILAEPKPEMISTLIDINRNLAAGLTARAA